MTLAIILIYQANNVKMIRIQFKYLIIIKCLLLVFAATISTAQEQLNFINRNYHGEGGIHGLRGPMALTISPDQKHVYTTTYSSLSVFAYDTLNGNLTHIKTYLDHDNGFDGLKSAAYIAVSKDNKNVYVSSESSPYYISIFDRDTNTGLLTVRNLMNTSPTIGGAAGIEISNDDKFLYLASWSSSKISVYSRDTLTGDLTWMQSLPAGSWAESLKLSVDNKFIYVTSFLDNSIYVYQRDSLGSISLVQTVTNGTGGAQGLNAVKILSTSSDNKYLYTAGYNTITAFARDTISGFLNYLASYTDNVGGIDGIDQAFSITIPPDNKSLHVITSGDSSLTTFLLDTSNGLLTYANSIKMIDNDYHPLNIYSTSSMFSSNTELAVAWYWDLCIKTYHRDTLTSLISLNTEYKEGQGVITTGLRTAKHATVSADNKAVYSCAYDGISILSRNDTLGKLIFQKLIKGDSTIQGLTNAINILITPDNKYVYVAGNYDDAIVSFSRDTITNDLTYIQTIFNNQNGVSGLDGIKTLAISPDERFIYSGGSGSVVVFDYDSSNGSLVFNQKIDLRAILGLTVNVERIKVSADGKYLIAPGWDNGFFWFKRDTLSGQLTYLAWYRSYGLSDCDISADVKNVYAINPIFDRVMSFSINSANDSIYMIQVLNADSDHVEMIRNPRVVSISNDDRFVFVTSTDSSSVNVFQRMPDGKLKYIKYYTEENSNHEGLDGISSICYSPDSKNIYFTSDIENSISAYKLGTFLGNDISACVGDTIILTPGSRYVVYNWSTGASGSSIIVTSDGTFSVSTTDPYGFIESDTVNVHFNNLPIVFLGIDETICPGDQIPLDAGSNFKSYSWNTGATAQSISVTGGSTYSVLVVDSNDCKNSDSVIVDLYSKPFVDLGPDTAVCDNFHFTLIPNTSANVMATLWNTGDTTLNLPINNSGNYSLTVTDSNQCVNTDTVMVTIYYSPLVYLGPDTTIHINQSMKIGTFGFSDYLWSTGETSPKITIDTSSFSTDSLVVWVQVSDIHCSSSDTIVFHLDSTYIKDYFNLVDTNKIWHLAECTNLSVCGTSVLYFEGDTTIAGTLYKKLIVNQDSGGVGSYYPIAAREDTSAKQVFFYIGNTEYLAYDFSLTEGDTISTIIDGCSVLLTVLVDNIAVFPVGEKRKTMYMSNGETWIEGIGSLSGLPNAGLKYCTWFNALLNCFTENDTVKLHHPNFASCYYNLVGIQILSSDKPINIYPNPFSDFTTVNFDNPTSENCKVSIYDMKGVLIKEYKNIVSGKLKIERGTIENGIYFVRLQIKDNVYVQKIVIE